jgi:asparagine synthase (glutamine-hydrolysing)
MPGIVGIIGKGMNEARREHVNRMVSSMMHEPTYVSGTYNNDEIGLYSGWVCHKDSFSDCMPLFSEDKSKILIFQGENFADTGSVQKLRGKGHELQDLNASYLIHQYEEEGRDFFQRLNGWFSGILVDLHSRKVTIFNDRYGMGRIYYHENRDGFYFSSEAKGLLKILPELREIDPYGLGEFLGFGCTLQNRTLFKNISIFPGGSLWMFEGGKIKSKENYFSPNEWEGQLILSKEIFYEELKKTVRKVMSRYFHSKGKIGISLTGGIDTRVIMAYLENSGGLLPCYTFGGMYRDCYDVVIARRVAKACHQPHHVLRLGHEFLSNFGDNAWKAVYITDGCLDICGAHEIYLNKLAREIAPIRMTGNYGSEVLRHFSQFKADIPCQNLFHADFKKYIRLAEETLNKRGYDNRISQVVFKEIPRLLWGKLFLAQSQLTLRTPYMDNDLVALMYRAPEESFEGRNASYLLIKEGNPGLLNIATDRGIKPGNSDTFKNYRKIINWASFKAEWYYNTGMPDWLSKFELKIRPFHLEGIFLGKHKIEHYRIWFQRNLSEFIKGILSDDKTKKRWHWNGNFIEEMAKHHINGRNNYLEEINKVITIELLYRGLIESL